MEAALVVTRTPTSVVGASTQDVVEMSLTKRLRPSTVTHQARRAAPTCRGGASSVLRLAQPAATRFPSSLDIDSWVSRAANALRLPSVPNFAPSEFTAG